MRLQYTSPEIAKTLMVIVAIAGFVVIILAKVPEWTAPENGFGTSSVLRR